MGDSSVFSRLFCSMGVFYGVSMGFLWIFSWEILLFVQENCLSDRHPKQTDVPLKG